MSDNKPEPEPRKCPHGRKLTVYETSDEQGPWLYGAPTECALCDEVEWRSALYRPDGYVDSRPPLPPCDYGPKLAPPAPPIPQEVRDALERGRAPKVPPAPTEASIAFGGVKFHYLDGCPCGVNHRAAVEQKQAPDNHADAT